MKTRALVGGVLAIGLSVAPAAFAKTQVTYWYPWGGNTDANLIIKYAQEYNATHPDVEIVPTEVDGSGVSDGKLTAAVLGGSPPDLVLYWGQDQTGSMAAAGVIQPLSNFVKNGGLKAGDFFPPAWNACRMNGETYCIPEMVNVSLLYYNTDLFAKAGLNTAQGPATLEELVADAQKLTLTNTSGTVTQVGFLPLIGQGPAIFWAHDFGGSFWDAVNQQPTIDSPGSQAAAEWMQEYGQQFKDSIAKYSAWDDYFVKQTAAMQIDGEWQLNGYSTHPELHYNVEPPPAPKGGNPNTTLVSGNVWWIPAGAKHAKEAWDFLQWMSQPERSGPTADQVHNISPLRDAAIHQQLLSDPKFEVAIRLAGSPNGAHAPVTPFSAQLLKQAGDAYYAALHGTQPAKSALTKAQQAYLAYVLAHKGGK